MMGLSRSTQTVFWIVSEKNSVFCVGETSSKNQLVHAMSFKYIIHSRFQALSKEAREVKSTGEDAENVGKGRCRKGTVPNQ